MLSDKLRQLRLRKKLTQAELARQLSLSPVRYNQYETGRRTPDYELLISIADYYKVSLDYLLDRREVQLKNSISDPKSASLIEKLCAADDDTKSSVEQYLNFLLHQKKHPDE